MAGTNQLQQPAHKKARKQPTADVLVVRPGQAAYQFQPFKLRSIDYKSYDGLFDSGINMYPRPRSGHRIVCNDTDLFCFGGFNPVARTENSMMFQEFWRFNTLTKKWKLVFGTHDELPQELASHAMCMNGDTVVIFGGTGFPFGEVCSNRVHVISPYAQPKPTISELQTTGSQPRPLYGQAILVHDDCLYVVGGTTGHQYTFDVHRLCFRTLVWKCLSSADKENVPHPLGRYRHEIVTDGRHIFVIGGGTSTSTFPLSTVSAFCLTTNVWQCLNTLPDASGSGQPRPRKCHSCVHFTNDDGDIEVIMAGGSFEDVRAYRDMWRLNLRTLRWSMLHTAHFPKPLHFHDAAYSSSGLMYVFGGIEKTKRDAPYRTNNAFKVWVKIPKLSEMCWEAMTSLWPGLSKADGGMLRQAGVPERFMQRLALEAPREENFDL